LGRPDRIGRPQIIPAPRNLSTHVAEQRIDALMIALDCRVGSMHLKQAGNDLRHQNAHDGPPKTAQSQEYEQYCCVSIDTQQYLKASSARLRAMSIFCSSRTSHATCDQQQNALRYQAVSLCGTWRLADIAANEVNPPRC
jgi:hypothetical protein